MDFLQIIATLVKHHVSLQKSIETAIARTNSLKEKVPDADELGIRLKDIEDTNMKVRANAVHDN